MLTSHARAIAAFLVCAAAAVASSCAPSSPDSTRGATPDDAVVDLPAGSHERFNVLLVTIDTLRTDHVGAYGEQAGLTPTLDRFAERGIRFASAFAHATMTLPSHASILTGEYPFQHGVRDNGTFRLDDSRTTLAEVLSRAGYRTGAFVGAFVLDVRFGLAQGFDLYDDFYGEEAGFDDFNFVERRAEQVLEPAAAWIEGSYRPEPRTSRGGEEAPWFAWVHLFDPHVPYDPPAPHGDRHPGNPYAGEVAYVDAALGDFLDRLGAAGHLDRTLIVATSDHGESLGEHGEKTHGAFAYNATLQIPLILWSSRIEELIDAHEASANPGSATSAGQDSPAPVFADPVGHVDILPTVLELLGLPIPHGVQGSQLLGDSRPIYFEALSPWLTLNLAPLTGVIEGEYKFIELPVAELYHLPTDAAETNNRFRERSQIAQQLRATLQRLIGTDRGIAGVDPGDLQPLDEATRRRLQSLGYLAATSHPTPKSFTAADDPKNAIDEIEDHRAAMTSYAAGDAGEAIRLLQGVIDGRPASTVAHMNLASVLFAIGRLEDAIGVLNAAAGRNPDNPLVMARLGSYLAEAGALDRAVEILESAAEKSPHDVEVLTALAVAYGRLRRENQARELLERALEIDPSSASTYNNIGTAYLRQRNYPEAIAHFRRAIELAPSFWPAYEGLGGAYVQSGRLSEAADAWERLIEIYPRNYDAIYNLGIALAQLERFDEALTYLERFTEEAPPGVYAEDIEAVKRLVSEIRRRSQ